MKDKLISEHEFVEDLYGCLDGFDFDLEDVLNVLKGVEPVDAMPVVHGHWVGLCGEHIHIDTNGKVFSACYCSRCGEYLDGSDEYIVNGKFCPSCGARMDELFEKTEQLRGGEQDERT